MSSREIERLLWALAVCVLALAWATWVRWRTPATPATRGWSMLELSDAEDTSNAGDDRFEKIVNRDPFRLARHPSPTPFQAESGNGMIAAPQVVRPNLVLNGVVGGPPWSAVITGLVGRDGNVVVRQGETFGPLRIQSITRDGVVIQGLDTTWHLSAKGVPR